VHQQTRMLVCLAETELLNSLRLSAAVSHTKHNVSSNSSRSCYNGETLCLVFDLLRRKLYVDIKSSVIWRYPTRIAFFANLQGNCI